MLYFVFHFKVIFLYQIRYFYTHLFASVRSVTESHATTIANPAASLLDINTHFIYAISLCWSFLRKKEKRNIEGKEERKKDRRKERKKDRREERKKERKRERKKANIN